MATTALPQAAVTQSRKLGTWLWLGPLLLFAFALPWIGG